MRQHSHRSSALPVFPAWLSFAALDVEIEAVPAFRLPDGNEPARLLLAVVANQNKPLSQLELGGAFRRLFNSARPEPRSPKNPASWLHSSTALWNWRTSPGGARDGEAAGGHARARHL